MVALGTGLLIGGAAVVAATTVVKVLRDGIDRTAIGGAVLLLGQGLLVADATMPYLREHDPTLGVAVFACCLLASALFVASGRS